MKRHPLMAPYTLDNPHHINNPFTMSTTLYFFIHIKYHVPNPLTIGRFKPLQWPLNFIFASFIWNLIHACHTKTWHFMALDQGRVFVGNKTYIMQVMTTTNNLTIEWLGFVHLTNLNMSKKHFDMFPHICMGSMIHNYFNFKNLTISSTICNFRPLRFNLLKMMVPF